eukprot:1566920-Pleurochrysis_carterae.AAC.2
MHMLTTLYFPGYPKLGPGVTRVHAGSVRNSRVRAASLLAAAPPHSGCRPRQLLAAALGGLEPATAASVTEGSRLRKVMHN